MVWGLWFGVYGLGFMVWGLWFGVYGLGFMVWGLWFGVYGFARIPWQAQSAATIAPQGLERLFRNAGDDTDPAADCTRFQVRGSGFWV